MSPNEVLMETLRRALSVRRPHGSYEEGALLTWVHARIIERRPQADTWIDAAGNLHVDMRHFNDDTGTSNRTLFVAHVDTVHRTGGPNAFDDSTPMWKAAMKDQPLGADDGAGVAMLSALIHACVPAYYIFSRGEECGGVGSSFLAKEHEELLSEFDRAIAFDRKDVFSVITHQGFGGRCCSDEFAEALCGMLNDQGMMYMPDDGGVYTDTAEWVDIIPECTNLSAGYYEEHRPTEHLDTEHLQSLLVAALSIDWDALPTKRDPSEPDDDFLARWEARWSSRPAVTPTKVGTAPVLATVGGIDVGWDEDDPAFSWKDDAGRTGTGSKPKLRDGLETVDYRAWEIQTARSTSTGTFNYTIVDPLGEEVDFGFGYPTRAAALAEAMASVDDNI